jgi:hypothetical protein
MSTESAAAPAVSVDRTPVLRGLGAVGTGAGVLFAALVVWERVGSDGAIVQAGFLIAMAGYVALAVGLDLGRAAGNGRSARAFPLLLAAAWLALIAAGAVEALTSVTSDGNPLYPIGGLGQAIGLVGTGLAVAVAGRWSGWRRLWPLGLALFYVGVLFVPAIFGVEPAVVPEALWALGYAGLGIALYTEAARQPVR